MNNNKLKTSVYVKVVDYLSEADEMDIQILRFLNPVLKRIISIMEDDISMTLIECVLFYIHFKRELEEQKISKYELGKVDLINLYLSMIGKDEITKTIRMAICDELISFDLRTNRLSEENKQWLVFIINRYDLCSSYINVWLVKREVSSHGKHE